MWAKMAKSMGAEGPRLRRSWRLRLRAAEAAHDRGFLFRRTSCQSTRIPRSSAALRTSIWCCSTIWRNLAQTRLLDALGSYVLPLWTSAYAIQAALKDVPSS